MPGEVEFTCILPGLTAFVKLRVGPTFEFGAAFLVQNLAIRSFNYVLEISSACVLFMEGFFFPSKRCEDRCNLLTCSNFLELGWKKDNRVAVSWDCPEELGSAWPKGVVYCGVTVGWRGEVQTAPVLVFGSMES